VIEEGDFPKMSSNDLVQTFESGKKSGSGLFSPGFEVWAKFRNHGGSYEISAEAVEA